MAARNFHRPRCMQRETILICGNFTTGTDGSVGTTTPGSAAGFTVTKPAGTGIYRITLDDSYGDILSVVCSLFSGTAQDAVVQVQAENATTGVIDVQVMGEATGALAAEDLISGGIHFIVAAQNTSGP